MNDDDLQLKGYQDDLDADLSKKDEITHELTDNLADRAGIPESEIAHEFKKMNLDEAGHGNEDMREYIEDADEDMGQAGKR
ncbi:MAG TPA: hypothetical protein VD907_01975 [Verrucomicrobiae bacterium]|nr:hypothetical protein [Verrucomicrobiae bacterium]